MAVVVPEIALIAEEVRRLHGRVNRGLRFRHIELLRIEACRRYFVELRRNVPLFVGERVERQRIFRWRCYNQFPVLPCQWRKSIFPGLLFGPVGNVFTHFALVALHCSLRVGDEGSKFIPSSRFNQ